MIEDIILSGCVFIALAFAIGICFCAAYMMLKNKEIFGGVGFSVMGTILLILLIGLLFIFIERGP